jgi:hypothetical protein
MTFMPYERLQINMLFLFDQNIRVKQSRNSISGKITISHKGDHNTQTIISNLFLEFSIVQVRN